MKVEIRNGHHYVDVSYEPEPRSLIEQFFASVYPEVDLNNSNVEFMDDDSAYITSVREVEKVIDRSLQKKGINHNYWEVKE